MGAHYEVANGVITKYYFAGSQRIALRTNGTLNYLLGDHLGSTSLTTDANGVVISEMRYKAWGETRYASGTTPTKYTYTGQYSYVSDFGLHFYNARWYDSSLSRFASADTIVPGGIQGLDRYAYVNNSPVRYTDPTGHWCEPGDFEPGGYCWSPASKPSTPIVINVCGYGAAGTCLSQNPNDPSYGNQVPLNNVANWAGSANVQYFVANSASEKEVAAKAILTFMLGVLAKNSEATFILVGHSAGADAIVWAVRLFLEDGGDPSRISGVVLLDSYLFTGDGTPVGVPEKDSAGNLTGPLNNQNSGNMIVQSGIPVLSLVSQEKITETGDHLTDFPSLAPPIFVGGGHKALAVDLNIFKTYIEPFLEGVK